MKTKLLLPALIALALSSCSKDPVATIPEVTPPPPPPDTVATAVYHAFDLGTLGSKGSDPRALDSHGVVFGFSENASSIQRLFRWEDGVLADLGALPPSGFHDVVSRSGLVAGTLSACALGSACGDARAFYIWRAGVVTEIPFVTSGRAFVNRITDGGTLLGNVLDRPVLVHLGVWHDLGSLDPVRAGSQATDMNEQQQIVGTSLAPGYRNYRAYLWENGVMTALPDLTDTVCPDDAQLRCSFSFPNSINGPGDVVGSSSNAAGIERPVLWRRGQPALDLGAAPGQYASGWLINDQGQVVIASDPKWYLWDKGTLIPLGSLGGGGSTVARAINGKGEIVGSSSHPDGTHHAFIWSNGRMIDLGLGLGGLGSQARYINERGDVVGIFVRSDFLEQAVLWRRASNMVASATAAGP